MAALALAAFRPGGPAPALGATAPADSAAADSAAAAPADSAVADSVPAARALLRIETQPSGLEVWVDGDPVGRSPVGPLDLPAKTVRVRVVAPDPRQFNLARDVAEVTLQPGGEATVYLDVRPSVTLRSDPEPAWVFLTGRPLGAPDSLLGETPLSVRHAVIETSQIRFHREAFADTTLPGSLFAGEAGHPPRVSLRPTGHGSPALGPAPKPTLFRKKWFQWTLVGVGAALSGAAVILHDRGDLWYERYLESSDVDEIPGLYDRATHYDRLAAVSLGVGQVSLIGGIILLLTGQSE